MYNYYRNRYQDGAVKPPTKGSPIQNPIQLAPSNLGRTESRQAAMKAGIYYSDDKTPITRWDSNKGARVFTSDASKYGYKAGMSIDDFIAGGGKATSNKKSEVDEQIREYGEQPYWLNPNASGNSIVERNYMPDHPVVNRPNEALSLASFNVHQNPYNYPEDNAYDYGDDSELQDPDDHYRIFGKEEDLQRDFNAVKDSKSVGYYKNNPSYRKHTPNFNLRTDFNRDFGPVPAKSKDRSSFENSLKQELRDVYRNTLYDNRNMNLTDLKNVAKQKLENKGYSDSEIQRFMKSFF